MPARPSRPATGPSRSRSAASSRPMLRSMTSATPAPWPAISAAARSMTPPRMTGPAIWATASMCAAPESASRGRPSARSTTTWSMTSVARGPRKPARSRRPGSSTAAIRSRSGPASMPPSPAWKTLPTTPARCLPNGLRSPRPFAAWPAATAARRSASWPTESAGTCRPPSPATPSPPRPMTSSSALSAGSPMCPSRARIGWSTLGPMPIWSSTRLRPDLTWPRPAEL